MTHAERALARYNELEPDDPEPYELTELRRSISLLDAIEQTREQRKVPQPLTNEELSNAGAPIIANMLGAIGLGIYRKQDVEAGCK